MIADKARNLTDKRLEELEKEIEKVYKEAQADITSKWNKYMANASSRLSGLQEEYDKAVKSGSAEEIASAKEKLQKAKTNVTLTDQRYKAMIDDTTKRIANANKIALSYANGSLPQIYSVNYNQIAKEADKVGVDFTIVDESTVKNLVTQGEIKLPKKKLDIPKDQQWNRKQLNSSVLQGILQGESMDKIAKRIMPIVDNNAKAAIRNARTMVTGAENKGRLDSYHDLEERGAVLKKVWIATKDDRTREWHLDMDGQEVGVDEPFVDGLGNELDYPGDPSAAPETVYNCRCSMRTRIINVKEKERVVEKERIVEKEHINIPDDLKEVTNEQTQQKIAEYSQKMSSQDVAKFNEVFEQAPFVKSDTDICYYDPDENNIKMNTQDKDGYTAFHEATHYYDFNQSYEITETWYRKEYEFDDAGNVTGFHRVAEVDVVSTDATFSEYIHHEWTVSQRDPETNEFTEPLDKLDHDNFVNILGLTDSVGLNRSVKDVKHDMLAARHYLQAKGVALDDEDRIHVEDFISAITYDSVLFNTHDYDYWAQGTGENRIIEITAGYNLLQATGRTDLIEIEKELAPHLMDLIEKEWKKIW